MKHCDNCAAVRHVYGVCSAHHTCVDNSKVKANLKI